MHDIEKRHNRNRDIGMIEDVDDGDFERWDAGVPVFFSSDFRRYARTV